MSRNIDCSDVAGLIRMHYGLSCAISSMVDMASGVWSFAMRCPCGGNRVRDFRGSDLAMTEEREALIAKELMRDWSCTCARAAPTRPSLSRYADIPKAAAASRYIATAAPPKSPPSEPAYITKYGPIVYSVFTDSFTASAEALEKKRKENEARIKQAASTVSYFRKQFGDHVADVISFTSDGRTLVDGYTIDYCVNAYLALQRSDESIRMTRAQREVASFMWSDSLRKRVREQRDRERNELLVDIQDID